MGERNDRELLQSTSLNVVPAMLPESRCFNMLPLRSGKLSGVSALAVRL